MRRLHVTFEDSREMRFARAVDAGETPYFWDLVAFDDLHNVGALVWTGPYDMHLRGNFADYYGMRTLRRVIAIDQLFKAGMYAECVPLVRAAYEDWVAAAYALLPDGVARCRIRADDLMRHDVKVRAAFAKLADEQAAARVFESNPGFEAWKAAQTGFPPPWGGATWNQMAAASGLSLVHDLVFTHLSRLSHGSMKNSALVFEHDPVRRMQVAQIPERNVGQEALWAIWTYWFSLRTLTLCAKERGLDVEVVSDHARRLLRDEAEISLASAACVRETLPK